MKEKEIREKLYSLGADEQNIGTIIHDVNSVIVQRIGSAYISKLDIEKKNELLSLPEDDIKHFLKKNAEQLFSLAPEEIGKIHQKTWKEYFSKMTK